MHDKYVCQTRDTWLQSHLPCTKTVRNMKLLRMQVWLIICYGHNITLFSSKDNMQIKKEFEKFYLHIEKKWNYIHSVITSFIILKSEGTMYAVVILRFIVITESLQRKETH